MTVTFSSSQTPQSSTPMTEVSASLPQPSHWFVLRVTYQRELITKNRLAEMGIDCFLPMQKVRRRNRLGRFCYVWEVAVHNYIFVHSDKPTIDVLKHTKLPWLRYCMQREGEVSRIMTVPERDMQNFIAVAGNVEEQIQYLDPQDVTFSAGDRVRILGGPFEGVEGHFVRLKHKRDKCVVIRIEGVVAVATTTIPAQLVDKIG